MARPETQERVTIADITKTRELSADELDLVSGAFKISFMGVTVPASAAHNGSAVSIERAGGISFWRPASP